MIVQMRLDQNIELLMVLVIIGLIETCLKIYNILNHHFHSFRLHPYWGRSNTCHIRLLPPDYSDGIQGFRMSKTGKVLPNPRDISGYVAESKDFKGVYTGLLLGWGQFVNHDLSFTVDYKSNPLHKGPLDCCKKPDNKCATIRSGIATKYDNVCRNFVRSSPCPLCKLGTIFKPLSCYLKPFD